MTEILLRELIVPGELIGKLVVDETGKICGISWAVKIKNNKCFLVVKGKETLEIPIEKIEIGSNIKVRDILRCPEIDLKKADELLHEIIDEMLLSYEILKTSRKISKIL